MLLQPQINLLLRDAVQGEDGEPTLSWQAFQAHMQVRGAPPSSHARSFLHPNQHAASMQVKEQLACMQVVLDFPYQRLSEQSKGPKSSGKGGGRRPTATSQPCTVVS